MYEYVPTCIYACGHERRYPERPGKGLGFQEWASYRWLVLVLGTELRSSAKAVYILSHCVFH